MLRERKAGTRIYSCKAERQDLFLGLPRAMDLVAFRPAAGWRQIGGITTDALLVSPCCHETVQILRGYENVGDYSRTLSVFPLLERLWSWLTTCQDKMEFERLDLETPVRLCYLGMKSHKGQTESAS